MTNERLQEIGSYQRHYDAPELRRCIDELITAVRELQKPLAYVDKELGLLRNEIKEVLGPLGNFPSLLEYLHYQYPATVGDILLNERLRKLTLGTKADAIGDKEIVEWCAANPGKPIYIPTSGVWQVGYLTFRDFRQAVRTAIEKERTE